MRVLLMLHEPALRNACGDFYETRGCTVDSANDLSQAWSLLRFRQYDLIVADLPHEESAQDEVLRLIRPSPRGAVRILLTTGGSEAAIEDDGLIVLTKPQPLDTILRHASPVGDFEIPGLVARDTVHEATAGTASTPRRVASWPRGGSAPEEGVSNLDADRRVVPIARYAGSFSSAAPGALPGARGL